MGWGGEVEQWWERVEWGCERTNQLQEEVDLVAMAKSDSPKSGGLSSTEPTPAIVSAGLSRPLHIMEDTLSSFKETRQTVKKMS